MPQQKSIFINYRHALSSMEARLLYLMLEANFPGEVFQDEKSLEAGDVWEQKITKALQQAKVMLVLISPGWISYPMPRKYIEDNPDELHKCKLHDINKGCHVRREIEIALSLGSDKLTIIPVLIDGAVIPRKDQLPEKIQSLFDTFNVANKRCSLDFKNPKVNEFEEMFRQIAEKADVNRKSVSENLFQPPLDQEFPLAELEDKEKKILGKRAPYIGLKPFSKNEARLFFGRSREIYSVCYRIATDPLQRIFLLEGYSGTGKSSLLQAGIIPRLEASNWAVGYGRREEDKINGLAGVLNRLLEELKDHPAAHKLLIVDQVEEVLTNPITILKNELGDFIGKLDLARQNHPEYRFMLGFRSEYTAHILHALKSNIRDEALFHITTLYPLDRNGVIEAINGVSKHSDLQGIFSLGFSPQHLPELIADRLLNSHIGYHIAPLLQVNMQLIWNRSRNQNGEVQVFQGAIHNLIDSHEKLLDHYLARIKENIGEGRVEELDILEILQFFTELEPVSAIRHEEEFLTQNFRTEERLFLLNKIKEEHLLTPLGEVPNGVTRLSHDVLAKIIYEKYRELDQKKRILTEKQLEESNLERFDLLFEKFEQQLDGLEYLEAHKSMARLVDLGVRQKELMPYLVELLFFWNEAGRKSLVKESLHLLLDSQQLQDAAQKMIHDISDDPGKKEVTVWLKNMMTENDYQDLLTKYYAPAETCMVLVEGGILRKNFNVPSFKMAHTLTTFRKFGLFLFANGMEDKLSDMSPNWGIHADHPVIYIDWYDTLEYCNWLSQVQGLEQVYTLDKERKDPYNLNQNDEKKWSVSANFNANGYRLPTEAEWEFAARGGNKSRGFQFAGSNTLDEVGWYEKNSDAKTHPVGVLAPNELGLYDMSGNVWEWCWDWYQGDFPMESKSRGPDSGKYRVLRGGSWDLSVVNSGVLDRFYDLNPVSRNDDLGFRLSQGL